MKKSFRDSKRGNAILDTMTIGVVIAVLALAFIMFYKPFDELNQDIQNDDTLSQDAKDLSNNLYQRYAPVLDSAILFSFVLLTIFIIISVFLIDTHPVFFILSIILLVSVFAVIILIANSYNDVVSDAEYSSYANDFTYTHWLMTHIVEMGITVGFIVTISMFIKINL